MVAAIGCEVRHYSVLPDERQSISAELSRLADSGGFDLILTTGGTGVAPRDVTPEATRAVLDRELPGMAEAMRAESLRLPQPPQKTSGFSTRGTDDPGS